MYFSIISTLVTLILFINTQDFAILAQKGDFQHIQQGQDIITGITTYLRALPLKKDSAPFDIMQLKKNYLESSKGKNIGSPKMFEKVPKQTANVMWKNVMEENRVSSIKKNTLIIPGQLGLLLLMIFQQTMCEAVTLFKQSENYPQEDREAHFSFLQKLLDESLQLFPENTNYLRILMPTLCLKRKLFGLSDKDQIKLSSLLKQSKLYSEASFVFESCFDSSIQRMIREFIWKIQKSKSSCSQSLVHDLLFSFDLIYKFHNEHETKLNSIEALLASALTHRFILKDNLEKQKADALNAKKIPKNMVPHKDNSQRYFEGAAGSSNDYETIPFDEISQEPQEKKNSLNRFFRKIIKKKSQNPAKQDSNKRIPEKKEWKDIDERSTSNTAHDIRPFPLRSLPPIPTEPVYNEIYFDNDDSHYSEITFPPNSQDTQTPASSSFTSSSVSLSTLEPIYATVIPRSMRNNDRIQAQVPISRHH